jgi:signal peptidase I
LSTQAPGNADASRKVIFNRKRLILLIVACVLAPPAFCILFVLYVAQPVKNEGTGMVPTINHGDRILFRKTVGNVERGDIIMFYYPVDPNYSFVKRVVGLPGETLRIDEEGHLLINGNLVHEPYLSSAFNRHPRSLAELTIKPEHYFVMGDNRDASNDSRNWGQVPESLINGKYLGRYWPLNQ